jgi:hypothetical protein
MIRRDPIAERLIGTYAGAGQFSAGFLAERSGCYRGVSAADIKQGQNKLEKLSKDSLTQTFPCALISLVWLFQVLRCRRAG